MSFVIFSQVAATRNCQIHQNKTVIESCALRIKDAKLWIICWVFLLQAVSNAILIIPVLSKIMLKFCNKQWLCYFLSWRKILIYWNNVVKWISTGYEWQHGWYLCSNFTVYLGISFDTINFNESEHFSTMIWI